MARKAHIDNEALLEAARAVFLRRGPAATSLDVAREAKVSEGTLFKRFGSKDKMFAEALRPTRAIPDVIERLPQLAGTGDLRTNLVSVSLELIDVFELTMPLMMLGYGHDIDTKEQPGPMRAVLHLARFFEKEIALGRMSKVETEHTALVLLGALINYVMTFLVMPSGKTLPIPRDHFVRGTIHLLWEGIKPR